GAAIQSKAFKLNAPVGLKHIIFNHNNYFTVVATEILPRMKTNIMHYFFCKLDSIQTHNQPFRLK
ncbi:MAG TPA: hypothetical protein VGK38_11915, partial [Prolixibacteraceae bacterium]